MALSGTLRSGIFGNGSFQLRLVWNATQSVSNNTSTINSTLYLDSKTSYGSINDGTNSAWSVKIDGATGSGSAQSDVSGYGSSTIGSYSRTVSHDSDGSKSMALFGSHYIDITWSGSFIGTQSVSGNVTLNTIPRASTISFVGGSTAEMNKYNDLYIHINRASGSFTHTLDYTFGGLSGSVAGKISYVDHEWTLPAGLATEVKNDTSGWGSIICKTYNGSTHIGTSTAKFTATIPNSTTYRPTVSVPTFNELNTSVTSAVGNLYVQGKSKIKVTATGGTKYGASIRSINYKVKLANHVGVLSGATATAETSPADSGTHVVVATVTDSRGFTSTSTSSFVITAYKSPSITDFKANRTGSFANTIQANASASMSAIGTANTVTMKIETSPRGSGTWTLSESITATSGSSLAIGSYSIPNMSITSSYDVMLSVYDELTSDPTTQVLAVGTSVFPMSWSKTGVGIGKIWERGALDVNGDSYFTGKLTVYGELAVTGGYQPIRLPTYADMNDIEAVGFYYNNMNSDAGTMKNLPDNSAFSLLVEKHAGVKQTFTSYRPESPYTWIRNKYTNTWGEFQQLSTMIKGNNENGDFIKYSDGTMICYGTALHNRLNAVTTYVVLPALYKDTSFTISVSGGDGSWATAEDLAVMGWGPTNTGGFRINRYNRDTHTYRGTGYMNVNWTTIGRWR